MTRPVESREHAFGIAATPERVLPMFTAEGERLWAPGWSPVVHSGAAEAGSVFSTGGTGAATTWIVTDWEPPGRVRYARLAEGSNMGLVEVRCEAAGPDASIVRVRYTLTPLSSEGARFVDVFLEPARYAAFIDGWKPLVERALGIAPG